MMKFLIIDDNPGDRELMIRELKKEFTDDVHFTEIVRQSDLDGALGHADFDVVITDYLLNWTDGLKILHVIKDRFPNVPVIMVTDSGTEEVAVKGMKAGLDDYVIKRDLMRLPFAVQDSLARIQAQEALQKAYSELEHRVEERTAELSKANARLKFEIEERERSRLVIEIQNEKLQALNEELETTNEELHVINEELETSNEELLSTTEELIAAQKTLRESKELSDALNDINASIASTLDVGQIMQQVVLLANKAIGFGHTSIIVPEDNYWEVRFQFPEEFVGERFLKQDAPHLMLADRTRAPVVITDADRDLRVNRELMRKYAIASALVVPLIVNEEMMGLISFADQEAKAFSNAQIDFAVKLAASLTLAMENARLYQAEVEAQKQARNELDVSNLLLKAADTFRQSLDLRTLLNALARIILEATTQKRVAVMLFDKDAQEFEVVATLGEPNRPIRQKFMLNAATPKYRLAFKERRAVTVDYEMLQANKPISEEDTRLNRKLVLSMPLVVGGEIIGAIDVDTPGERAEFTQRTIELVEGIATQAAIAIDNARLYSKATARARTFEAVGHMGSLITSSLSMADALGRIVDYSMLLLDVSSTVILLLDQTRSEFKVAAHEGVPAQLAKATLSIADVRALGLEECNPCTISGLDELSKAAFFEKAAKAKFKSAIISPLVIDKEVRGFIINQHPVPISLSEEEVAAFKLFVNLASIAIKNAEKYEAEHNIAETLQGALLTVPKRIEGIEFGHLYRSATESTKVGGDFFDIFELEHDRVGIVVGDVAGKGLKAAAVTSIVRNTIRAYAYDEASPAAVMTKVNEAVVRASSTGSFVTVFFGILDIKSGILTYCSAGHPPALVKRASKVLFLEGNSPIIGAFRGMRFEEAELTLKERDILLLYTDGITEARCDGGFFEEAGLVNVLKGMKRLSASEVPQAVFNEVMACSKGTVSDDIALLSLSLRGTVRPDA